jgi:RimJ/RimL family protein N-acetyltransferase
MEIQADTLFTYDSRGRMCRTREPNGRPAPAFFLGRTREGNVWRVRHNLLDSVKEGLELLASGEPVSDDLRTGPRNLARYVSVLRQSDIDDHFSAGPAYRFPEDIPPATKTTRLTSENVHLIEQMGPGWTGFGSELSERNPCWAVVQNGKAVSVCFSARLGAVAAEAGVETLEPYRGRGFAVAVVSAWARSVRDRGLIPLYSTAWNNHASQAVARKLRLIQFGTDLSL